MDGLELRSALAFAQAECTILAENAREIEEIQAEALIRSAEDSLRTAFDRLQGYATMSGGKETAWYGKAGEAAPPGV